MNDMTVTITVQYFDGRRETDTYRHVVRIEKVNDFWHVTEDDDTSHIIIAGIIKSFVAVPELSR